MIIYRQSARVLVQGITGKQGTFWTQKMMECGTRVVAGVNPKRAGEQHLGVPVYATAKAAMAESPFDVAVMFIPPAMAREAALDAIKAGARTVVILTEHIPARDVIAIHHAAARHRTRIIGPNTAGIVTPGEGFVGIMPGHNPNIFQPGEIGVISRSGSLGTLICLNLTRAGFGQSAFLGIGGDPMIGTTTRDALQAVDEDPRTRAVVLVGEIGGAMEEAAAEYAAGMAKPVVSFIAGRASPPGKKMGHAGAIVSGTLGSYDGKRRALEAAGVAVADTPAEIPGLLGAGPRDRLRQPAAHALSV
ncbi:succinate--CoA ligase subunit alpha [Methylorubrum populi]|jgi:succinyl-CoA synthetase alpha subunit|uniref:Succinate--CoA ligase subunit alpha n=1 Tax=Methylorubrum rhodesianum TaxID=29427 RepID=A0ABU9Z4M5_9HYPH|nr:succinate--CoA ligase subunit alpha [Methylorubrum rhodesianum]MBK3403601.1 succinate--CoA ligase subunit alpha [Methylorubrum rhodesianum]MBY0142902.1 succinate--CoA ligase subunit alpha [Methylorubrum populi]